MIHSTFGSSATTLHHVRLNLRMKAALQNSPGVKEMEWSQEVQIHDDQPISATAARHAAMHPPARHPQSGIVVATIASLDLTRYHHLHLRHHCLTLFRVRSFVGCVRHVRDCSFDLPRCLKNWPRDYVACSEQGRDRSRLTFEL